jgi:hypothetical protein
MSATTNPHASDTTDVPYRALMKAHGVRRRAPKRRKPRVGTCVACGRHGPLTKDHIVPQALLNKLARRRDHDAAQALLAEVRDDPANWQDMCDTTFRWGAVYRYGCNALKGDQVPAIDYRPNRALHRRLISLLAKHDVPVDVRWRPEPWRG